MDFIVNHWTDIVGIAGALHLLALAVVNVTPSKKDDEIYNRFYKVVEIFAGLVTKTAKE